MEKVLPKSLVRCKRKEKYDQMEKARQMLDKQADIVQIIRMQRFFKLALSLLIEPEEHRRLKALSKLIEIDDQKTKKVTYLLKNNDCEQRLEEIDKMEFVDFREASLAQNMSLNDIAEIGQ